MGDTQHRWQQIEAPLRARVWLPSKVAFTGRVNARSPTATASGWKALPSVDHHRPASASDQAKLTLKVVKLFNRGGNRMGQNHGAVWSTTQDTLVATSCAFPTRSTARNENEDKQCSSDTYRC